MNKRQQQLTINTRFQLSWLPDHACAIAIHFLFYTATPTGKAEQILTFVNVGNRLVSSLIGKSGSIPYVSHSFIHFIF